MSNHFMIACFKCTGVDLYHFLTSCQVVTFGFFKWNKLRSEMLDLHVHVVYICIHIFEKTREGAHISLNLEPEDDSPDLAFCRLSGDFQVTHITFGGFCCWAFLTGCFKCQLSVDSFLDLIP